MRIGRRALAGLLTAALLVPVPALAITHGLGSKKVSAHQTTRPGQATAVQLVDHQTQERVDFNSFSKSLRAQFRGGDSNTKKQVKTVINQTFKDLKAHWRQETRTKTILSEFSFPVI